MGRHARYPYDIWADGQWHEVHPSAYAKTNESLRATIHQWANSHEQKVLTIAVDKDTLAFRFIDLTPEGP